MCVGGWGGHPVFIVSSIFFDLNVLSVYRSVELFFLSLSSISSVLFKIWRLNEIIVILGWSPLDSLGCRRNILHLTLILRRQCTLSPWDKGLNLLEQLNNMDEKIVKCSSENNILTIFSKRAWGSKMRSSLWKLAVNVPQCLCYFRDPGAWWNQIRQFFVLSWVWIIVCGLLYVRLCWTKMMK